MISYPNIYHTKKTLYCLPEGYSYSTSDWNFIFFNQKDWSEDRTKEGYGVEGKAYHKQ